MLKAFPVTACAAVFAMPANAAQYFGHLDGTFVDGSQTYWELPERGPPDGTFSAPMAEQKISIDFLITERKNYSPSWCGSDPSCFFPSFYEIVFKIFAKGPMSDRTDVMANRLDTVSSWDSSAIGQNESTIIDFGPNWGRLIMAYDTAAPGIQEIGYKLDLKKGHGGKISGQGYVWGADYPEYVMAIQGNFRIDSGWMSVRGGVPEPSSWGLLILGFGVVGSSYRRSKKGGLCPLPRS